MIKIDENFTITNDGYSWNLKMERVGEINPKTQRPKIHNQIWHCSNIKQCLNRYVNECTKPEESVENLISKLNEVESLIKNLKLN